MRLRLVLALAIMVIVSANVCWGAATTLSKAEALFSVGDYKNAAILANKEIQAQPMSAAARFLLGKSQRELGDPNWQKTFDTALNCDKKIGPRLKKYLVTRKDSCYDDLAYLVDSHKELIGADQGFYYRYWVKDNPSRMKAHKYAEMYPKDKVHAPEALHRAAEGYYYDEEDTETAHGFYEACLKYPDSEYCKLAKDKLADYWDIKNITLDFSGRWKELAKVEAGQQFDYKISEAESPDNITIDGMGFYIFVGTEAEGKERASSGQLHITERAGPSGSKVAEKSGSILIRTYPFWSGYRGTTSMVLRIKRL